MGKPKTLTTYAHQFEKHVKRFSKGVQSPIVRAYKAGYALASKEYKEDETKTYDRGNIAGAREAQSICSREMYALSRAVQFLTEGRHRLIVRIIKIEHALNAENLAEVRRLSTGYVDIHGNPTEP